MATAIEAEPITGELITSSRELRSKFEINEAEVIAMNERVAALIVSDKESRALAWEDRQTFRKLRVSVEKREEALTENAKAHIKSVKEVAKTLIGMLTPGEKAIVAKIEAYDAEIEAKKKAAEDARKAKIKERFDTLLDLGARPHPVLVESMTDEEFEAARKEAQEAFDKRVAAEKAAKEEADRIAAQQAEALRLEQEKLAKERAELEAFREAQAAEEAKRLEAIAAEERAKAEAQAKIDEANRIEREKIEAQRMALEAERERLEQLEAKRLEDIRIEREKVEQAERDRLEAIAEEKRKAEEAKRIEQERLEHEAKLEALKPEREKIRAFGDVLRLLAYPIVAQEECVLFVKELKVEIDRLARLCDRV